MQRFIITAVSILVLISSLPQVALAGPGPASPDEDDKSGASYLRLDRAFYRVGECVRVTVRDPDENTAAGEVDELQALLVSAEPGGEYRDRETLRLKESGPDTGAFESSACLPLAIETPQEHDGALQVAGGDLILGLYEDPDNPALPDSEGDIQEQLGKLMNASDAGADLAVVAGGQAKGDFSFEVEDALAPQAQQPLDVIVGPQGFPLVFGSGRIVFQPADDEDLAHFAQQHGAKVIEQFEMPVAGDAAGPNDVPELRSFAVLQIEEADVEAKELPYLAELLGATGHYRFSSEGAAGFFALLMAEQIGGRLMHHDPVAWQMAVPSSEERPNPDAGPPFIDGLAENMFGAPDVRVREAITYLDMLDRNPAQAINMAVIDGGFARPADYPAGDPLAGMVNPDFGLDSVADGGPNPAFQCAGGPGAGCDWHGTASLSVAAAVVDNQFGAAGVAGHGRLEDGTDGVLGLAKPVPMTAFSPFYSSVAREINQAVDDGVDLINLSAGFPCEPFIGIDFCQWETRAAAWVLCTALLIHPGWLGPIGGLLSAVIGSIGCGALHTFISEVDFAAHDALRSAVNRARLADIPLMTVGPEVVEFLGQDWGPFVAGEMEFLPCILDGVICVGAMHADAGGNRTPMPIDPFGSAIDIWAPGDQLVTTPSPASGGNRALFSGTSAATPFISGVVAMMMAARPGISTADILTILQETSNSFDIAPVGTCTPHPTLAGVCVGYVDALAAVKRAADVDLTCFNGDAGFDDTQWAANDLGTPTIPAIGDTTSVSSGADRGIHALPDDVDFYRFRVPVLPAASMRVPVRVSIATPMPEFGDGFQIELFSDIDAAPDVIDLVPVEGPGASLQAFLDNDRDHYVRVFAPDQVHARDNCYELTVEVLNPPAADRYERNDEFDDAPAVTEGWTHQHLVCPPEILRDNPAADCTDVLDDGIGAESAQELWTMTIPDLSLHSIYDRDFFQIELPDPTAHDSDIVECGMTTRNDGFGDVVDITMPGALIVEAVPTGNAVSARPAGAGGEKLAAYRTTGELLRAAYGAPFRVQIDCPRTRENLQELLIAFGERPGVREAFAMGGYELRLTYLIEVQRGISPRVADMLAGREARLGGAAPCFDPGIRFGPGAIPSEGFPNCPPDLEGWGRIELFRPDTSNAPDSCWNDGPCPDVFIFHVAEPLAAFDARVLATPGLGLRILNGDLKTLAQVMPGQNGSDGQQGNGIDAKLQIPPLEAGFYYLVVDGPAGMLRMDFAPPAAQQALQ